MKLSSLAIPLLVALSVGATLSGFGQVSAQTTPSGSGVVIPDGTDIRAELKKGLDASKVQVGDPVKLEVTLDVRDRVTGAVLIPKKARLSARLSHVDFSKEKNARSVVSIEIVGAEWEGGSAELHGRIMGVQPETARVQPETARVQAQQAQSVRTPSGPCSQQAPIRDPTTRGEIVGSGGTRCEPGSGDFSQTTRSPVPGPLPPATPLPPQLPERSQPPSPPYSAPTDIFVRAGKLVFPSSNHSLPSGTIFWIEHRVPSEATKENEPLPPRLAYSFESSRDAALRGEAEAQFQLGLMYHGGKGVDQGYARAAEWYRKAAEQGLAKAQNNLAVLYAQGQGVPQDYVTAYMWFTVAAAAKPDKHPANLQLVESHMTPEQIAEGKRRAEEWLKQHPASH